MSTSTTGGRPVSAKTVHPDNAYLARVEVQRYNTTTNQFEAWSNTNVQVFFAEDAAGDDPIAGMTGITLNAVSGAPGVYAEQIGAPVMSLLEPYVDETVYQIALVGPTLADARVVTPLVVRQPRYALQG